MKIKKEYIFKATAILFVALSIIGGVRIYSPVPYWDMWGYLQLPSGGIDSWWAQHNEHRILLARALFAIDTIFFNATGIFLVALNYILLGLICLTFYCIWQRIDLFKKNIWFGWFLIAWLFYWIQSDNLSLGFQCQFFLAQLLPIIGFYFLYKSTCPNSRINFCIAVTIATAAVGSMANGVVVLPLMFLYSLLTRMHWRRCVILIALTLICFFLYFYNYKAPSGHGDLIKGLIESPLTIIHFILLYLGGPFFYIFGENSFGKIAAVFAGAASVVIFLGSFIISMRNLGSAKLNIALLMFAIYVGGTAFVTAGGRYIFGIDQALSSRYMTPVLMYWAIFMIVSFGYLEKYFEDFSKKVWPLLLIVLLLMVPKQLSALYSKHEILYQKNVSALAIAMGVKDQDQISNVFPSAEWALSFSGALVENKISVFGKPWLQGIQTKIGKPFIVPSKNTSNCEGFIDGITVITSEEKYLRVKGWAYNHFLKKSPEVLWILGDGDIALGYVIAGQNRPDVANVIGVNELNSGFNGYVLAGGINEDLKLFDPVSGCKIQAVPKLFPLIRESLPEQVVITAKQVISPNTWTGTDFYRSKIGNLIVFGSYISSDNDVGALKMHAKRGDKILYRSGPVADNQRIIIESDGLRTLLIKVPASAEWETLDFSGNHWPEKFIITFVDSGTGWGEWSAVAVRKD